MVKHVEAVNAAVRNAEAKFDEDDASDDEEESFNGIEEPAKVDHEDDYLDEDKHTVVTVEAVTISHEGLQPRQEGSAEEGDDPGATKHAEVTPRGPPSGNAETGLKDQRTIQNLKKQPKKKKKFRYESKAERKVTRMKERSGGKAKAKERRGK